MKNPKYNLLFLILLCCTQSLVSQIEAVPISFYGTWDRGGEIDYSNPINDFIVGIEIGRSWSEVQPNPPTGDPSIDYNFSDFRAALQNAADYNKIVKLSINPGPNAPHWIYDNGVPEAELDTAAVVPKHLEGLKWPYYLSEAYVGYYYDLIEQFSLFLRTLPEPLFNSIAFVQVKTGYTGDEEGYKIKLVDDSPHLITPEQWSAFRIEAYKKHKEFFNDVADRKIVMTFNAIDPDKEPEVNDWVFNQIDPAVGFGIKGGFGNRGHHLVGEKSWAQEWVRYLVDPEGLKLFSASEMDQSWEKPIFEINTNLGFYWAVMGALHSGLSSMNVSKAPIQYISENEEAREIFKLYNKFSRQVFPETANAVLSVFHEGLDASDTVKFPEDQFENANRRDSVRYRKIVDQYADRGAKMGDYDVLAFGQVEQRRQQKAYNDVGWDIIDGNYERFLYQINPDSTSIGLFHVRGEIDQSSSKYDRFARSFDNSVDRKKDTMYFKFHDDLFVETLPRKLTFNVTWLDSIAGSTWALQYKDTTGVQKQLQITSVGDSEWKSEEFVIEDLMTGGVGTHGADFMLVNTDDLNDIFHGIEIDIERQGDAIISQISSAVDGDWHLPTTWTGNVVPTSTDDIIVNHAVKIDRSFSVAAKNLTISATGNLTIQPRSLLTVNGNLVNNNSITFNASSNDQEMGAVKILGEGTFTGNDVTANIRPMALPTVANNWFLISSPLKGASITDFIENSRDIRKNADLENSIGFYDDTNSPKYTYYTDATAASAGAFVDGKGYAALVDLPSNVNSHKFQFNGKINTDDVSIPISDAGNGYNLIGNPYTSYIYANTDGDTTNNVLTTNSSVLEENTLWFYDAEVSGFVTKNLGDTGFDIPPAQGFFVRAKIGGGTSQNFSFTEAMQSNKFDDGIFYKSASNSRFEFDLTITDGNKSSKTSVRYINGTSTDFDNGYDSSVFTESSDANLKIATQLVANNTGKNLAIQSLPTTNYEGTVIPINITAEANKEFIITANVKNLPENMYVFLEDRVAKTVTRLDEANTSFKMTPNVNLQGSGRFYMHTKATSVLSLDTETLTNVSIFKTSNNTLKIIGLQNGETSVKVFNILGKQILATSFNSNGSKEISLPILSSGVYIVMLENEASVLNKKIILE